MNGGSKATNNLLLCLDSRCSVLLHPEGRHHRLPAHAFPPRLPEGRCVEGLAGAWLRLGWGRDAGWEAEMPPQAGCCRH